MKNLAFAADRRQGREISYGSRSLHGPFTAWFLTNFLLPIALLMPGACLQAAWTLRTTDLVLVVDESGSVTQLTEVATGANHVAAGQPAALLSIEVAGQWWTPEQAIFDPEKLRLTLRYREGELVVQGREAGTHLTLEVVEARPLDRIDRLQWGPIPTALRTRVAEVIGLVADERFAIGMMGLNVKTLGGPVDNQEDRDPSRGRAAQATSWGSTLQAHSLDRSRPRHADVWGGQFPRMPVPPIPGETVVGSKVALYGVAAAGALGRIGEIELAEKLPHPEYQGQWSRQNRQLGRSYLIAAFSEQTIDEMIGYARQGNFLSLYHPAPFRAGGHYELDPKYFPRGEASLKACADKARDAGLLIGVHTLTNFINTNDPYVTPVPDRRLARTGASSLVAEVSAEATEIEVASPEYFNNTKSNWLKTVMIGEELVRYGSVSGEAPWKLLDCRRGAFGTRAAAHAEGAEVAKLMDHPYRVFLTNFELQNEIAGRLADLFNRTGVTHFDFDGHEGCHSSGQGDYAVEMFAKVLYDRLDHFVHNGTSNSRSFYWHINTCCNWGEPWYGGFRSSMADYRISNQAMLERNYMPRMLGWFQLTPETTLADVEWLMARSAGFDSGFALATSRDALRGNPSTGRLLETIGDWEALRMRHAFPEPLREAMRDSRREFHLSRAGDRWAVQAMERSVALEYEHQERQPGEPTFAEWTYEQTGEKQPLQWVLEVLGEQGSVEGATLELDKYLAIEVPLAVAAGQTLVCDGTGTLRLYDAQGKQVRKHALPGEPPQVANGAHEVMFSGEFQGDPTPKVRVHFQWLGSATVVE